MKGMDLSRAYFQDAVLPRLERDHPELLPRLAAGLVGNGSDCFGYDDDISRDHDWGVEYFLWLPEELAGKREALEAWRQQVFLDSPPWTGRVRSAYGARIGVQTVGEFYRSLLGSPEGPETLVQWLQVPEENLAMAVNGEVFLDRDGSFTAIRDRLLQHYPDDVRKKKLAAKCMAIAQTGQYNFLRMAKREDWVTVRAVLTRFADSVMGAAFLLNRRYRPYYKWSWRALGELPILGQELSDALLELSLSPDFSSEDIRRQSERIEAICARLLEALNLWEGVVTRVDFFTAAGEELQASIGDELLRSLPATYE